jgi:hypothetical protein
MAAARPLRADAGWRHGDLVEARGQRRGGQAGARNRRRGMGGAEAHRWRGSPAGARDRRRGIDGLRGGPSLAWKPGEGAGSAEWRPIAGVRPGERSPGGGAEPAAAAAWSGGGGHRRGDDGIEAAELCCVDRVRACGNEGMRRRTRVSKSSQPSDRMDRRPVKTGP